MEYIYLKNKKGEVIGHLECFNEEDVRIIKAFIQGYLCRNDLDSEETLINLFESLIDKCYIVGYHIADYTILELDFEEE